MNDPSQTYKHLVNEINKVYDSLHNLSNDELRSLSSEIRATVNTREDCNALNDYLTDVYAIVKETARRFSIGDIEVAANNYDRWLAERYDFVVIQGNRAIYKRRWDSGGTPQEWNMIHYDEQLLGGILLHYGYAIEMATGEGKTLVATLPVFLNALTHKGVHLMTANSYLSKRDFETTRPIYMFHGITADCIERYERYDFRRKEAYRKDITFGTHSSFTFDYLFDHIAMNPNECVQHTHNFAIIDELDAILIDDADEPHIVGGGNYYDNSKPFKEYYPIVKELVEKDNHHLFDIDKIQRKVSFTIEGKKWLVERLKTPDLFNVKRPYELENFESLVDSEKEKIIQNVNLQNTLYQILVALTLYERDVDYVVEAKKIKIIDPHTGRIKETSRWEHGLHTAIEVKEDVPVQKDFDGMAVISLKNYFRLYNKIAGMSGTIMSVHKELSEIYGLKCAALPTHKPMIRFDAPLRMFRTTAAKDNAIINTINKNSKKGRPTLVGCLSLKRAGEIASMLEKEGFSFKLLDARNEKQESYIISKAGERNAVTVSTSMAGRGTDIKPSSGAIENGGLLVIGTDLFDSIRIDQQLKGRSGRQGNPGSSQFFASLDDLILKNLSEDDQTELQKLVSNESESELYSPAIRTLFLKAQENRENFWKRTRAETARKDDIVAPHRKKFYTQRNAVLFDANDAVDIINDILKSSSKDPAKVHENLNTLYLKTKELIIRSTRNNINREQVLVPFSDNMHTFAIRFDVNLAISSFEYFCKEFKRQIILQIYDKCWKDFVLYMMGNLDKHEIEMLDNRYNKMMAEIHTIILSRLCESTIPFDMRHNVEHTHTVIVKSQSKPKAKALEIKDDAQCPCGSEKKFCECHGLGIRRNRIKRRR